MTTATRLIGKFVWHELATPDVTKAQAFYRGLFGWRFRDVSHGDVAHHLVLRGDADIAGIWPIDAEHADKVTPHWGGYVSVEDVDVTAAQATAAGGKIVAGPYEIPRVGRMAVLEDPTGATVVAYRNLGSDPADHRPEAGEFCWNVLVTSDLVAAKAFYQTIFGWTATPLDQMPGHLFRRADGAMVATTMPVPRPDVPSHWAHYVAVDDLAAARARVIELGGHVVREEVLVPGVGRFAIVQDPTGAYLRLFQG